MKKLYYILIVALLSVGFVSCDEEYVTYSGPEYVMFADSLSTNMVTADKEYFSVPVSSTVACDYERTFGVEVVDAGSNAIEGVHYRLLSNTITIPAGELATEVKVAGLYDNIEPTDSLGFRLQLVMPEQLEWDLYENSNQTKVVMYKSCPYDINNFTGWCVLTSLYLYSYPGTNTSYQRLIYTEKHPSEENTIILRRMFNNGFDVTMTFDPSDPAQPLVTMDRAQVIGHEDETFGIKYGDNKILSHHSPYYKSYFNSCQRYVELWNYVYVENMGELVGNVGHFYNILEWISDEEADALRKEGF